MASPEAASSPKPRVLSARFCVDLELKFQSLDYFVDHLHVSIPQTYVVDLFLHESV